MNKSEIIKQVVSSSNVDEATVKKVFDSIIEVIQKSLLFGINVKIHEFLTFTLKVAQPKKMTNLNDGKEYTVPKKYRVAVSVPITFRKKLAEKTVY